MNYNFLSSHFLIVASGFAPVNSSMTCPFLKSFADGIDIMLYFDDWVGALFVSIFAKISFPSNSFAIFSKTGFNVMHGPHHSAQKSTRTGIVFDFCITSFSNVSSVTLISIIN